MNFSLYSFEDHIEATKLDTITELSVDDEELARIFFMLKDIWTQKTGLSELEYAAFVQGAIIYMDEINRRYTKV